MSSLLPPCPYSPSSRELCLQLHASCGPCGPLYEACAMYHSCVSDGAIFPSRPILPFIYNHLPSHSLSLHLPEYQPPIATGSPSCRCGACQPPASFPNRYQSLVTGIWLPLSTGRHVALPLQDCMAVTKGMPAPELAPTFCSSPPFPLPLPATHPSHLSSEGV